MKVKHRGYTIFDLDIFYGIRKQTRRSVAGVEEGCLDPRGWTLSTAATVDMEVLGEPMRASCWQDPRGAMPSEENEGGGAILGRRRREPRRQRCATEAEERRQNWGRGVNACGVERKGNRGGRPPHTPRLGQ
jgi:hypothetical protein